MVRQAETAAAVRMRVDRMRVAVGKHCNAKARETTVRTAKARETMVRTAIVAASVPRMCIFFDTQDPFRKKT